MAYDEFTLLVCVLVGFFVGFIMSIIFIGIPFKEDLDLLIENIDCVKLLEIDVFFRTNNAESFVKSECF